MEQNLTREQKEDHEEHPRHSVSFIIPTLNEEAHIGACLEAIDSQNLPPGVTNIEIIVVDNGSTDRTVKLAEAKGVKVINVPKKTVAASRNAGAEAATGVWLAFIDADCTIDSEWLNLGGQHLGKQDVVAFGTNSSPPPEDSSWVEKVWHHLGYEQRNGKYNEVDWLPTFNILIKASTFKKVGGFDEALETCEDSDLGYKLHREGKLILDNRVHTQHVRESQNLVEFWKRESWRGMGNWKGFFRHSFHMSELPSLLAPVGFLFSCLSFVIMLAVLSGSERKSSAKTIPLVLVLFNIIGFPFLMVWRKRLFHHSPVFIIKAWVLALVYLLARGTSPFIAARRSW